MNGPREDRDGGHERTNGEEQQLGVGALTAEKRAAEESFRLVS